MNNKPHGQQVLSESLRLAYLQAMEVPVWVSRQSIQDPLSQEKVESSAESVEVLAKKETIESVQLPAAQPNEVNIPKLKNVSSKKLKHFLKMVPWVRGNQQTPAILVICRHQVDQPAQSFARANSPSQFMTDFIQAFFEFLGDKNTEFHIRLGHLAQAGLGQDCQELEQVVETLQPKLVLLLGDETVKELFQSEDDVARLRGKLLMLDQNAACLATYHPYSLIKNPSLKKLAQADLKFSAAYLLSV